IGFAPNSASFFRLDPSGTFRTFPLTGDRKPKTEKLARPTQALCIAITADARHVAIGGIDQSRGEIGEVMISDVSNKALVRHLRGLNPYPTALALTADGSRLAVAGPPETPPGTVWDVATGRELKH